MKLALSLLAPAAFLLSSAAFAQDSFGQPSQQPQYPAQQPSQYPQQPAYPDAQQPAYPNQQPVYPNQQPAQPGGGNLDQLAQMERQDYGVQPVSQLHAGAMHGPTPASIPGGQVVTTKGVIDLMQGAQVRGLIFDVLGGPETLPGALAAAPASQPGSFTDQTQQEFGNFLQQQTQGNKQTPLVFYCQSTQCWMSYNASLRAINMGYTNVLWYRGGIEAWKMAGQQTQQQGQQQPPQQPAQRPSPY